MTFERQKKFLFISSKFQTPADKVIKVSAGTEAAQYLERRRGKGECCWVESYLLFTKFLPFTWPCQLPAWGDLCQSLPNSFEEFLSGSSCGCEATLPPCLSQMCHWTPQMCFQASYLETVPSWRKPYMEETSIHMDIAHDSCTPSGSTATKIIMI